MAAKPPCPACYTSLELYYQLRDRLHSYFFEGQPMNISNSEIIRSYTFVYNLLDKDPGTKLKNEKKYELYEQTFAKVFKNDLINFCKKVQNILNQSKGMSSPIEQLGIYYDWIIAYTRFLHWTYKTFMLIEKNSKSFGKSSLFHQGLLIMRDNIILPYYENLFNLVSQNLQLFKEGRLTEYFQLQFVIQTIGMCGFSKYRSIKLQKNSTDNFQFNSINKQTMQKAEIEYETQFFLKNFTSKTIRYLQNHYHMISSEMMKLSTSEYVSQALQYIQKQEKAAEYFYPNNSVRRLIISSVEQILIATKCEQLITNQKTGLFKMIEAEDIDSLRNLYKLLKRTSQHKMFAKYYQSYIQKLITQEIFPKITPEEEKAAKKETVALIINLLYDFFVRIDKITNSIHTQMKDTQDLSLFSAQSTGFQVACNKSNTTCNFLAYHCDYTLKKEESSTENSMQQLVQKLFKLTKFLYSMDNFLKLYQRLLGVRILYDTFKNRQTQLQIINTLKNQVGVNSMTKINAMIADLRFSENFNTQKIVKFKNKLSFNFQVNILTSGSWQIGDHKNSQKIVPPELLPAVKMYQEQYSAMMPGRQITWIFNFGRGIVQVKFDQFPKALLFLNNYQLLILLYFQRRQFFCCKISTLISDLIPEEEPAFMASIQSLLRRGILLCKSGNPAKIESKQTIVEFNLNFKPKSVKTFCFQIPRFTQKTQSISKQLVGERNFIIQANIIKLMKAKRVLHYHQILQEIPKMCKTFKAQIGPIKNQIENCIHKDYLERDSKDINVLIYKP